MEENLKIGSVLLERIGIDRTVVAGFRIVEIDFEKLKQHHNVSIEKEGKFTYLLNNGEFCKLEIKDHVMFGVLRAGVKRLKGVKQDYATMDIMIGNAEQGNLQNQTVLEYHEKLIQVFWYLYEEYGVLIDATLLKFKELEVNCTFKIKEEFHKYHRPLRLLMFNLPKTYKKLGQVQAINEEEKRLETETFWRGNGSIEVKIYNKQRQLEETGKVVAAGNIMRIEFKFKTTAKIKGVLKSASVWDLTDEKIIRLYRREFQRAFEKKYNSWKKSNGKELRNKVIQHKQKAIRYWQSNLLRECSNMEQITQVPVLLDVNDLMIQIKKLETGGHFSRVRAGILKQCSYNDVFLQNDSAKVEEIFNAVAKSCDESLKRIEIGETPLHGEVA